MEIVTPLRRAVNLLGGVVATAKVLDLKSYQVVQQWFVTKVPAERCPDIERATGGKVTCEELRPDLAEQWAYLRGTSTPPARPSDDCGRRTLEARRSDEDRRSPESDQEAA